MVKKTIPLILISTIFLATAVSAKDTIGLYKFKDCSFGDLPHLIFVSDRGEIDFGEGKNKLNGIMLCLDTPEVRPNKKLVGQQFLIRWRMQKTKVYLDRPPTDRVGMRGRPTIISIKRAGKID